MSHWLDEEDQYVDPITTYFDWKRIDNPVVYFDVDFAQQADHSFEFYLREATVHGLEPQDFAQIVVTVAHFVERAASDYPCNLATWQRASRLKSSVEERDFRLVPFGEIYAVLGTNTTDNDNQLLLKGTSVDENYERLTEDGNTLLPASDFKAHVKFLILALSWLLEVGVLHIRVKWFCEANERRHDFEPYDRRVHSFQELCHKCRTDFTKFTYCFTPQELYSNAAWKALVAYLKRKMNGISHPLSDRSIFTSAAVIDYIEQNFNYEEEPYWCSVVYRDAPIREES